MTIYSKPLNESKAAWISGILNSKDVRYQSGTSFIPIVLLDGSQVLESTDDHIIIRIDYQHANEIR